MTLAKILLAAAAALAMTACGGQPRISGDAPPQAIVAEMQPAGGRTDALIGVAEQQPQGLVGDALPQTTAPQGLVGDALPQSLMGQAQPVVSNNP